MAQIGKVCKVRISGHLNRETGVIIEAF